MRLPRILFCVLGICMGSMCYATGYSLKDATEAAGALMPKEAADEFLIYNLRSSNGKPKQFLRLIEASIHKTEYLAICSPRLEYVRDLLKDAMNIAKEQKFNGLYLVIISDRIDEHMFDEILKGRGITIKLGVCK